MERDGITGREAELAAIEALLDDVADGPAVLALSGEAGIGKTTVWRAGVQAARERDFSVLACRPAAAEVRLSYAGLTDLLAEVGEAGFDHLPRPQRRALDAALLRGPGDDPALDPRAVAAGTLAVVDELADTAPVLLAVDDLQWLDEPSRRVVAFAVRRCTGPVATLTTRRSDEAGTATELSPRDPDRQRRLTLGPLSLGALHHVIRRRLGRSLSRPSLVRITEASGGNPFLALELARSHDLAGPDRRLLPEELRAVVTDRIERLAPHVRDALLVASTSAAPDLDLVAQVLDAGDEAGEAPDATEALSAAEDAGVIELAADGAVSFTHPLLASGVYSAASPRARRGAHRRLSAVVDDPEERARHLALAAVGPDPETVAALDVAAARARRRGAPMTAAELLELAIGLGASDPPRRVQAAHDHFHAGDPGRAQQLLEEVIDDLDAGTLRAEALALLATIRFDTDGDPAAAGLLEQAHREAADDPSLRCAVGITLGYVVFNSGGRYDTVPWVEDAVDAAERAGDDGQLAEALAGLAVVRYLLGLEAVPGLLDRALALEDPDRRTRANTWPTVVSGLLLGWSDQLREALAAFAVGRRRCRDLGADSELWFVSFWSVPTACAAGELAVAEHRVAELEEHADFTGADQARAFAATARAVWCAWVGEVDAARTAGEAAVDLFRRGAPAAFQLLPIGAVGMAELSVGDHEAAARWLAPPARTIGTMFGDPAVPRLHPDTVEALVTLGRSDEAEPLVAELEVSGRRPGRDWGRAVGARGRGLLLAAEGRLDAAEAAFAQALTAHDAVPERRYDRARTLLAAGQLQRRRNQRRAARASLQEAARLFDAVGCQRWADNARTELDRLGTRPGAGDRLTASEDRVARLAASGMTVREMAVALYVSPKTVEAHLTRIYRKLGIHSRAELGARMAERRAAARVDEEAEA